MAERPVAGTASTPLDPQTRWQVSEVLSRFGHIVDNAEWSFLPLVFAPDATLDAQDATLQGLAEIQRRLETAGPWRSHHTLNTITRRAADPAEVSAWSRFLIVEASGTTISGDYVDLLTYGPDGWRIRHRRLSLRNRPGSAPDGQPWRTQTFADWNG